jgi:diguanylate cyclase (GGDEF)-like protein/PAS domain S-box-containing protein
VAFSGIVSLPVFWLVFALQYAGLQKWLARPVLGLLSALPLASLALEWSNTLHHLFWAETRLDASGSIPTLQVSYGPWFYLHAAYSYALILLGAVLIARTLLANQHLYRAQTTTVLIGLSFPGLANFINTATYLPVHSVNLTPFAFTLTGLILTWGIFRYRLFDLVPVARAAIVERMNDAVFVVDALGRVIDANPAAGRLLGRPPKALIGKPAGEVFAQFPLLAGQVPDPKGAQANRSRAGECCWSGELTAGAGQDRRFYESCTTTLADRRGRLLGKLIIAHEITIHKQAAEALARFARGLEALYQTALEINAQMDVARLFPTVVARAVELVGARNGGLYLVQEAGLSIELVVSHNYGRDFAGTILKMGEGLSGKAAQTGKVIFVEDYQHWDGRSPQYEGVPFQRALAVPLKVGGRVIGVITVTDERRAGPFSEEEIRLVSLFADQTAVAIEKARLFETTRRSARQIGLVNRITKTALDAAQSEAVYQALADQMAGLIDADGCYLTLWDEHTQRTLPAAASGKMRGIYASKNPMPDGLTMTASVLKAGHTLVAEDVFHSAYISPNIAALYPARSILGLPLIAGSQRLGAALIAFDQPHRFTPEEIDLCEQAAGQIALAVAKVLLYEKEHRRAVQLHLLHVVSQGIAATLDEKEILQRASDALVDHFGYDWAGAGMLVGEDELEAVAMAGAAEHGIRLGYRQKLDQGIIGHVAQTRLAYLANDVSRDPFYYHPGGAVPGSALALPLIREGKLLGVLYMESSRPGAFGEQEVQVFETLSSQVATAIENARLYAGMQRLAITDALTGLYNLRGLNELGRREIERARRFRRPLAAIMFDIDHFKSVNDAFSHAAGNQVLAGLAERSRAIIRDIDIPARYGGEEFVILLPETDLQTACQVAERLRRAAADPPFPTDCGPLPVTISLGVAASASDLPDLAALLDRADAAMYAAKQEGRNRVCVD